jgi:hypothetical protein
LGVRDRDSHVEGEHGGDEKRREMPHGIPPIRSQPWPPLTTLPSGFHSTISYIILLRGRHQSEQADEQRRPLLLRVMERRTRREHFSSAALSMTDDLLHCSEAPGSAIS